MVNNKYGWYVRKYKMINYNLKILLGSVLGEITLKANRFTGGDEKGKVRGGDIIIFNEFP